MIRPPVFSLVLMIIFLDMQLSVKAFVTRRFRNLHILTTNIRSFGSTRLLSNVDDSINQAGMAANQTGSLKQLHRIVWNTADGTREFEALEGELLRTAALRRGVTSPHNGRAKLINCRGLGTCGTCAVEVLKGDVDPKERNEIERLRLSLPPHGGDKQSPNLRLACQIQVQGDLEITKRSGFWGQYEDLSPSSDSTTYFGDLEFLLDTKSPPQDDSGKN